MLELVEGLKGEDEKLLKLLDNGERALQDYVVKVESTKATIKQVKLIEFQLI